MNEGDICQLKDIHRIAQSYQCIVVIDDTFGCGFFDGSSNNILEFFKFKGQIDFITGSFSGIMESNGGFIVYGENQKSFMNSLKINYERDAILPNTAGALLASYQCLETPLNTSSSGKINRCLQLFKNILHWKNGLKRIGLDIPNHSKSTVIPIFMPTNESGIAVQKALQTQGLYVSYESNEKDVQHHYKIITSIQTRMTSDEIDQALEIMGRVIIYQFPEVLVRQPLVNYLPMANPIKNLSSSSSSSPSSTTFLKKQASTSTIQDQSNFGYQQPKFAIIGIGCHFPEGIESKEAFWKMLEDARCITKDIPKDRWDKDEWYSKEPIQGTIQTKRGAFLKNPYLFDNKYFYISMPEAKEMSPEQRWLLELTVETLEDANIKPEAVRGSRTGVFIGSSGCDYLATQISHANDINSHSPTGFELSILANRLSYVFDLQGPSISCNTACSSAFSALNIGLNAMITDDCEMALVAGSNFMNCPGGFVAFSQLRVVSPDGSCKPFDEKANGYARLEGAGMVLIKPYEKAVRDGDKIYCAIVGCGSNEDGRSPSLTMPSYEAQYKLLSHVCEKSGILPSEIDYVEAHGTGTKVGDPIESHAIGDAYGRSKGVRGPNDPPVLVSSVKGNTGHGENSSGIVSIIKTSLMLHKRKLVPTVAYHHMNPAIDAEKLGIKVCETLEDWKTPHTLHAAVNSFGFGGANTNTILEEVKHLHPQDIQLAITPGKPLVAKISGYNEKLVIQQLKEWRKVPKETLLPQLYLSNTCREDSHYRISFILEDPDKFYDYVDLTLKGRSHVNVIKHSNKISAKPKLAFTFSGQGTQYPDMGRQLYHSNPYFANIIDYCNEIVLSISKKDLLKETGLFGDLPVNEENLMDPQYSFLAIGIIQLALVEFWKAYGVEPSLVFGHSMGEVAAAYAAGILTLEDAILLLYHYGLISQNLKENNEKSGLIALGCGVDEAKTEYIKDRKKVYIASINSYKDVTLGGDLNQLEEIMDQAKQKNVFTVMLKVNKAFHTPFILSAKEKFLKGIEGIHLRVQPPKIPFISSTHGNEYQGPFDANYWWSNIINPVNFSQAVKIAHTKVDKVLEISSTPVLGIYISSVFQPDSIFYTLSRKLKDHNSLCRNIANMYAKKCFDQFNWRQYWIDFMDGVDGETLDKIRSIDYPMPKHAWDHRDIRKTYTAMIGIHPERKVCIEKDKLILEEESSESSSDADATLRVPDSPVNAIPLKDYSETVIRLPSPSNQFLTHPIKPKKPRKEDSTLSSSSTSSSSSSPSQSLSRSPSSSSSSSPSQSLSRSPSSSSSSSPSQSLSRSPSPSPSPSKIKLINNHHSYHHPNNQSSPLRKELEFQERKVQQKESIETDNEIDQKLASFYNSPIMVNNIHIKYNIPELEKVEAEVKTDVKTKPQLSTTTPIPEQMKSQSINNSLEIPMTPPMKVNIPKYIPATPTYSGAVKAKDKVKDEPVDMTESLFTPSDYANVNNNIVIESTDRLVHVIFNRPEANNSFTEDMLIRLMEAYDPNKILLIESKGKNFSTGWDLNGGDFGSEAFEQSIEKYSQFVKQLEGAIQPIVVVCQGSCRGGSMLFPLMADYVIAYEDANFGFPEVRRGGIPALVSVAALKKFSRTIAKRMMLLGEPIQVEEAKKCNLVDYICHTKEQCNELIKKLFQQFITDRTNLINLREFEFDASNSNESSNHQDHHHNPHHNTSDTTSPSIESTLVRCAMEEYQLTWDISKELVKMYDLEEGIAVIEMCSPQNFNGMNLDISRQLHAHVNTLKMRKDVKCVIVRGYRRHFCTGADPSWVANIEGKTHLRMALEVYEIYRDYASILELNVPVIGMLNGRIVGGGLALSLNCDWRVALKTSTIDFGNLPRGVCPGMMLSVNMESYVKRGRSFNMYLQPGSYGMTMEEALSIGIIQEIADSFEDLQEKAIRKAREIVQASKQFQGIDRSILLMRTPLNKELIMKEAYLLAECAVYTDMANESKKWSHFSSNQNSLRSASSSSSSSNSSNSISTS